MCTHFERILRTHTLLTHTLHTDTLHTYSVADKLLLVSDKLLDHLEAVMLC